MRKLEQKITAIMRSNGEQSASAVSCLLYAVSLLYGFVMRLRSACYRTGLLKTRRLPCRVISIGNITTGGTGKTPLALYVAELVHRLGYRAVILSRGYKGSAEKSGGIVSENGKVLMTAEAAGDEPFMMAERLKHIHVPVVVGQDRYASGRLSINRFNPQVIVLDDAFQHTRLARDIDLVLLDSKKPIGNGHLLPRGMLREPPKALSRADAFIMTRSNNHDSDAAHAGPVPQQLHAVMRTKPVFKTAYKPYISRVISAGSAEGEDGGETSVESNFLHGHKGFGFSGIARNEDFEQTIAQLGCQISGFMGFPDHYRYTKEDLQAICDAACDSDADCLLTTEKDYVRVVNRLPLKLPLFVVGLRLQFRGGSDTFDAYIKDRLAQSA
jgi:tetraacyldisaccharide 4'-kinase